MTTKLKKISDNCGATFCLIAGNWDYWHPEETICRCYRKKVVQEEYGLPNGKAPKWIKTQERIAKYCKEKYGKQAPYAFTYEMLDQDERVVKGSTKGINVDYDIEEQVERFFNTKSGNSHFIEGED